MQIFKAGQLVPITYAVCVCVCIQVHGNGRHVSIDIVSKLFDGKNSVARQRMVYCAER